MEVEPGFFYGDLETLTKENDEYRVILSTSVNMQLVLMSIPPGSEIGMERHQIATQFIRIESGDGIALINNRALSLIEGAAIMIPPNTLHNIINTSETEPLKLYTIYSPPEHVGLTESYMAA